MSPADEPIVGTRTIPCPVCEQPLEIELHAGKPVESGVVHLHPVIPFHVCRTPSAFDTPLLTA